MAGVRWGEELASLCRIAFVPLIQPDTTTVAIEYPKLRTKIDARLKRLLREDDLWLLAAPEVGEVR